MSFFKKIYANIFEDRNFFEAMIYFFWRIFYHLFNLNFMRTCFLIPHNIMSNTGHLKEDWSLDYNQGAFEIKKIFPQELCNYEYNKKRISQEDIYNATKNGDILYIVTSKGANKIVSYGWYSFNPTEVGQHLLLSFPQDYIYMYNGYTEPEYRGFRLHGLGMQYATLDIVKSGRKGLVSFVNIENYRSIRSCKRLGYQFMGWIMIFNFLSKEYIINSAKMKKLRINLTRYNLDFISHTSLTY